MTRKLKRNTALLLTVIMLFVMTGVAHAGASELNTISSAQTISAIFHGQNTVNAGNEFDLTYGLVNVSDSYYAQDLTFSYDPARVDFVSAESVENGFSIIDQSRSSGQIRIITATPGAGNAVSDDGDLLKLRWKAASDAQGANTSITLSKAIVSNGDGVEASLASVSHSITIGAFLSGDMNGDGKVSIGDLAMAAKAYGKSMTDPDWDQFKAADLNQDGKVDIVDLAILAGKILGIETEIP
jgi:hypothetical protein